jgi:hypothetical protein
MKQKLTLTEERNRMLKLINFNFDDHTHDNLSENFISEQKIKKNERWGFKNKER